MTFGMAKLDTSELSHNPLLWQAAPPRRRACRPDEIAGSCVFLASEMARNISGATLAIDGGTKASSGWVRDTQNRWTFPIVIELAI